MRVYIADDEPQQRSGMEHLIKAKYPDVDVFSFKNGVDCLKAFLEKPADIIFSDIRMPHMSGLDMTEKMRKINPFLVVVLISAYTEFEYARRGIDLGVFAYLIKPINPQEVFQIMDKALEQISAVKKESVEPKDDIFELDSVSPEQAMEYAIQFIRKNYMNRISLQDIARKCHYSASHFSMLFKAYTDMSFISYLNDYRLERARQLLLSSQKGIADIASSVGFNDAKYFTRLFIRKYGVTPNSCRKVT